MKRPYRLPSPLRSRLLWSLTAALAAIGVSLATRAAAQVPVPDCPPPNAGFPTYLPAPPQPTPRPLEGPGSIAALVQEVSHNDAAFEIVAGQGRILTTKMDLVVRDQPPPLVAVGDPTVIDFAVINARQIRIVGRRIGVTDLSITLPDTQTYNFEVRVVADLHVLDKQLKCLFPDACLRLTQVRDHIVVEGQARDTVQVDRILTTIQAYLVSVQVGQTQRVAAQQRVGQQPQQPPPGGLPVPEDPDQPPPAVAGPEAGLRSVQARVAEPVVINMIRVPGPKQVLLKVRVAELNRTAFRQIGSDFLALSPSQGMTLGSQIGGSGVAAAATAANRTLQGFAQLVASPATTAFGVFENADFSIMISALRRNNLLKILAEPNLVALHGHAANFLAGGEFPVPVPQVGGAGIAPTVTVQFREFGVRLGFLPLIQDGDVIRLAVDPEVSTIDFSIGTTLVAGGAVVPGLNTRKAHTVVEMREGQTLAIAGLLQLTLDGSTQRIPGLGDLPILGPLFSNTTGNRIEKELIVLVTPYLVEPMNPEQVPPSPGDEVKTPNDWEFYFLNRIEGRTGYDWRATTDYDNPLPLLRCLLRLDAKNVRGPFGYCN